MMGARSGKSGALDRRGDTDSGLLSGVGTLDFAFVGCGNAARFHADVIRGMGHRISAVCSRNPFPRRVPFAEIYEVHRTYDSWGKMLEKESPDALIVAASWDQTETFIEELIRTGIPCLAEKPIALTSEKLEKIVSSTENFHDRVVIGYNRRFYDFIPLLKSTIQSHELLSIELNFPEAVEYLVKCFSSEIANRILVYMSSHWIDLLLYLVGDLRIEYMHRGKLSRTGPRRSYNGVLYSLSHNVPVHLQANFDTPSQISLTFNFVDAIYKLCPIEVLTVFKGMDRIDMSDTVNFRRYVPRVADVYEVDATYKPGFYRQMEDFIETCVKRSQPSEVGCTLSEALKAVRLCEEIKGVSPQGGLACG